MVTSSIYLTHQTPLFHRYFGFSRKVASHFGQQFQITANHSQIPVSSGRASCLFHSYPVNFGHGNGFKDLGSSKLRFRQMDTRRVRVPAAGDGVSGGGYGGGPGDGDSGDGNENDGDGENWSFLSWYLALLAKYPMLTKAVTGALLTFIGDLICQLVIDQLPSLDLKRIFMFTLLGLVLVGPTLHIWYLYLSKLVTLPGASGALLRLVLDQFIFSPIFIGVFLSSLVTLEGRPSQVVPKLQQEWFSAVTANWQLWIPFQFLNFRFVPQQFQVLAANVIALVWNVILSFKAHKEVLQK